MSTADLSGVYVKLDRARAHLRDFDTQSHLIIDACQEALTRAYDRQRSEYVMWLDPVPEVHPVLSAVIGDAVHNLRASLDHLAWKLVIADGITPNSGSTFPIEVDVPKLDRRGIALPNISPGVSYDARSILDEVQPYKREKPESHGLATLHRLDIGDKHRQLLIAVLGIDRNMLAWWGDLEVTKFNPGPYDKESEVCRYTSSTYNEPRMDFTVRFNDPAAGPWGTMYGAAELVRRSLACIEYEVLPRFERFLRRVS